jgi:hypothetical protein
MIRPLYKLPNELISVLLSVQGKRRASTAAAVLLKPKTRISLSPPLRLSTALKRLRKFYQDEYPSQEQLIDRLKWALEDLTALRQPRITSPFIAF